MYFAIPLAEGRLLDGPNRFGESRRFKYDLFDARVSSDMLAQELAISDTLRGVLRMHAAFCLTLASLAAAPAAAASAAATPVWYTRYSEAQEKGRTLQLPLAIFFGTGAADFDQLSRPTQLSDRSLQILARHYVCAYLDLSQPKFQELARAFDIRRTQALVISDPSGRYQEFFHDGRLSVEALERVLERFSPDTPVPTMGEPYFIVTNSNFTSEVLQSSQPVLVDCWAEWCGPCRRMNPVMTELGLDFRTKAKIAKLNIDEQRTLASRFGISSIPTFLIFQNGQVVDRVVGATSKADLAARLEKAVKK